MIDKNASIVIAGAGSIGCYVGGCLALGGRRVTFLARPRIEAALESGGLRITDLDGRDRSLSPTQIATTADPAQALAGADIVLVCVKSGATAEMAGEIAAHAPLGAVVVSLQNGVGNAEKIREAAGPRAVLAGMVPFNVVQSPEGEMPLHVHRASEGAVLVAEGVAGLAGLMGVECLAVETHADMASVQWGKLLLNLNNALVALSNRPLVETLSDRRWRLVLAAQMDEALAAMRAARIEPARIAGLRPALLPKILRLPDWLFKRLARRMLSVDPQARSSMWEDLQRRRLTEIDELQGAVLQLAARGGTAAPTVERVAAAIREAEAAKNGSPGLSPDALRW